MEKNEKQTKNASTYLIYLLMGFVNLLQQPYDILDMCHVIPTMV